MIGIGIMLLLFLVSPSLIQRLAKKEILFVSVPANCFVLVTTKENQSGNLQDGGGNITKVLHAIPGKKLRNISGNLMDARFVNGRQWRGLLYLMLGVQWMGPFRTLRVNKIRRFRYMKATGTEADRIGDFVVKSDDLTTKYVPFSGEQAIPVREAESGDIFALDFIFNIIEESTYPVRSILKVADANSILSAMVRKHVNTVTGSHPPDFFMKPSAKSTGTLEEAAEQAEEEAREQIGKTICSVTLISTSMPAADLALYEGPMRAIKEGQAHEATALRDANVLRTKAKGEADAQVTRAEGASQALRLQNEAEADRIAKVYKPMSESPLMVALRQAEAYENNQTVTMYAPGTGSMLALPTGSSQNTHPDRPPA